MVAHSAPDPTLLRARVSVAQAHSTWPWLRRLSAARGESPDPVDVAERACHLEAVEAGIPGGRQDQFASSHGGFLRLDFRDPEAEVQTVEA